MTIPTGKMLSQKEEEYKKEEEKMKQFLSLGLMVIVLMTSFLVVPSVSGEIAQKSWEQFPDFSDPNLSAEERFARVKTAILQTLDWMIEENGQDADILRQYAEQVENNSYDYPRSERSFIGRGYDKDGNLVIVLHSQDIALFFEVIRETDSQDLFILWEVSLFREAFGLLIMEGNKDRLLKAGQRANLLVEKHKTIIGKELGAAEAQQPFFDLQGVPEEIVDLQASFYAYAIAEAFRKYLAVEHFIQSKTYSAERALGIIHQTGSLSADSVQLAERIIQSSRSAIAAEGNLDKLIQSHLTSNAVAYFTNTLDPTPPQVYIVVYYFMLEAYRFISSNGAGGLDPGAYKKVTHIDSVPRLPWTELTSSAERLKPKILEHLKEIDAKLPEGQKFFTELQNVTV